MYTLTAKNVFGEKMCEITTRYLSDAIRYLKMNLDFYDLCLEDSTIGETYFYQYAGKILCNIFNFSDKEEG